MKPLPIQPRFTARAFRRKACGGCTSRPGKNARIGSGSRSLLRLAAILAVFWALPVLGAPQAPEPVLSVKYAGGPIPDPASPSWDGALPVTVPLQPQNFVNPMGGGSVKEVRVRGLHNGSHIAFRMEWQDATRDATALLNRTPDAAALMFPLHAGASAIMGNPQGTVNLWRWRADWQEELEQGARAPYPQYADFYNPASEAVFASRGNRPFHGTPVDDLNAEGPGTVTRQAGQEVQGQGVHAGDGWRVVFVRPLSTGELADAEFAPGNGTSFNVAVWNGSEGDAGAKKSVSIAWTAAALDPAPPAFLGLLGIAAAVVVFLGGAVLLWRIR